MHNAKPATWNTSMADITELDALPLSRAIREKKLSCQETMQAYLRRIEEANPAVNAIVSLRPQDELLNVAKEYDELLARGQYLGWMHGMPQAPKDVTPVRGLLTTYGSPLLRNFLPQADAPAIARMRAAGAIFVGRTNVPEFALGSQTYNSLFGPTRNALDPRLTAGGSSGGAAAALALNLLPVADGSDMMGSLRNPAAFNNVYGMRPSHGRVPSGTPDLFCQQLATEGPMARNVADLAMLLRTQAGRLENDPLSMHAALPDEGLERDFKGCRIGWLGDLGGHLAFDPGVLELCEQALKKFDALGARVESIAAPFSPAQMWDTWLTWRHYLLAGALGVHYADPKRRAQLKPEAIWEIEQGLDMPAARLYGASLARSSLYRAIVQAFEKVDFLVLPAAQVFPFDVEINWPREVGGRPMDTYHRWMEVTVLPSLVGCPALAVPAGFNNEGLPAGLQIIGRPGADWPVLQLGRAWEQA